MNPITYQQAFAILHRAGFVEPEIERLYHLRQAYQISELDQPPLDLKRLQFVQWLVTTGRLSEQLSEEAKPSSASPKPSQSRLKIPLERLRQVEAGAGNETATPSSPRETQS